MGRTLGVVIGRFQIDKLHEGHIALLEEVWKRHAGNMLVLLGDRNSPPTAENPLSFEIRKAMIWEEFPEETMVMAVMDHPSNKEWSKRLDNLLILIRDAGKYDSVTLYCGRDGFAPHYSGQFSVETLDFNIECSATERRQWIATHPVSFCPEVNEEIVIDPEVAFRRGIIFAMMHLPMRIYLTVDIACTRGENGDMEILMGQREWEVEENVWRLPGGFVERDESFKAAARREFEEETSAWIEGVDIIGDFPIKDWRLRGVNSVTHKTVLCHAPFGWGNVKANDDIFSTRWIPIKHLIDYPEKIVSEHRDMFINGLIPYLQSKGLL